MTATSGLKIPVPQSTILNLNLTCAHGETSVLGSVLLPMFSHSVVAHASVSSKSEKPSATLHYICWWPSDQPWTRLSYGISPPSPAAPYNVDEHQILAPLRA
jgi:hypothetical protein